MKLIIYGLGKRFQKEQSTIEKIFINDTIVGYSDRDVEKANLVDLFVVPQDITNLEFDLIVVTQASYDAVKNDLIELGIDEQKIISLEKICKIKSQGQYEEIQVVTSSSKRVLLVNENLGFHGSSMVCLFAAKALKEKGYSVDVAGVYVSKDAIDTFNSNGIGVIIFKSHPYVGGADLDIFRKYDMVISNTYPTIPYAHLASKVAPTLWWMHECPDVFGSECFSSTRALFPEIGDSSWMRSINILAVSSVAKNAFNDYYPNLVSGCLPYGFPDDKVDNPKSTDKIVFTIVGRVCELKGQDLFISVAIRLIEEYPGQLSFLIVGTFAESDYYNKLNDLIGDCADIQFTGEKNRQEMLEIYSQTDICVCSSRIECLQIVTVEGMMHEKLCITTDASGITDYITDGENGLVFESGNVDALYEKMRWAVEHYGDSQYETICHKGRETYEKYFTMEVFGDRLEKELLEAKKKFEANNTEAN